MYKSILLPVDVDDDGSWRKALPVAVSLARATEAELTVMTVVPDFGMSMVGQFFPAGHAEKLAEEASRRLAVFVDEHVGSSVPTRRIVRQGSIYEMILATARESGVDLIVIGAHRPELKDYLLGPNAARVVRHASASVLVVRE